jgi:hypothetical protein
MTPSLKAAQAELRRRLERIDDMHARAVANLPNGHTWSDVDALEIERCDMAKEAHEDFKAAKDAWDAAMNREIEKAARRSPPMSDADRRTLRRKFDQYD